MSDQIPFAPDPGEVNLDMDGNPVVTETVIGPGGVVDDEQFEVEVIDTRPEADRRPPHDDKRSASFDPDAEIDLTAGDAQQRIRQQKYEYHNQRRMKEALEGQLQALTEHSQAQAAELDRTRSLLHQGEDVLRGEITERNKTLRAQAGREFEQAFESGDPKALLAASEAVAKSHVQDAVLQQTQRIMPDPAQQQPAAAAPAPAPPVEPLLTEWTQRNTWFGKADPLSKQKTALCYALDDIVRNDEHISPATPEYYARIDEELEKAYPSGGPRQVRQADEFNKGTLEPASRTRPRQVVASARRTSDSVAPTKVTLNQDEADVARRLNVSLEDYAREKQRLAAGQGGGV